MEGHSQRGFTLIELSIVLVIIGLIIGGVLVGQDLIRAAEVRATITQFEKFNTAANTFYGKYGYLPGDIKDPDASSFGFQARGPYGGEGDGNGVIQGINGNFAYQNNGFAQAGETLMFWVDLSTAHLIDGGFITATPTWVAASPYVTGSSIGSYLPAAKIGSNNYFYVFSGNYDTNGGGWMGATSTNYLGLASVGSVGMNGCGNGGGSSCLAAGGGLSPRQAASIDAKVDDGLPTSGRMLSANLYSNNWYWSGTGASNGPPPTGWTLSPDSTTCFDNAGLSGGALKYSVGFSGSVPNCSLVLRMQAGD